ncbi:hypothetical protein [Colwellia echini]|uniref:Flagellar basal-body/hook protein C-terminal domain-containing protein n=1 Tax=Colwellia echini TaxID=1982103 RepID=A0ABY3MZS2_9GAMM|nr:hypothetical protein [Colwellia echini]TYK66579.1 hypothetical protein CWS31_004380 [Colwellia echini]
MEISSAFNSGLQGLQNARATADKAAVDIAASSNFNTEQLNTAQKAQSVNNSETNNSEVNTEVVNSAAKSADIPNLNQSIVDLKVAEYQTKASTEVIKSADDALGTLLDVTA